MASASVDAWSRSLHSTASTAMCAGAIELEASVFLSIDGTGDRIEFFPAIGVGDQAINMKLVSQEGREIPAFYHAPQLFAEKDEESPSVASPHSSTHLLLVDWPGTERLASVDEFLFNEARGTLIIGGQRFRKLDGSVTYG